MQEIQVGDVVYCEGASAILGDVTETSEDGVTVVWRKTTTFEQADDLVREAKEPAAARFGEPDGPTLLDVLASNARTALDDPAALGLPYRDGVNDYDPSVATAYAIDQLDQIIDVLNPAEETRENYARTLEALGRHLAERQDEIAAAELTYEEHDPATKEAYETAHDALTRSLDALDEAINALTPGD